MTKQTFIVTQSERKTMINFIYKNLERPDYVPSMAEYRVWLNGKSVTQLRNLVINACEIIEMNCAAGSLAWQDVIEKFPKIFDDSCDVIDAEYQLQADDRGDIFTTSELEMFFTNSLSSGKRIENQKRAVGVHADIVENYIIDINQLFNMSEFFASKKLQDSIAAHKDFLRSSEWNHGSSCFSWQELKCLRLQQKLCLQCIALIANSRVCEVASVTSKQLNHLVEVIAKCNTKICEM